MDIRKVIDHFMFNYSPGDMVNIEHVVEELKKLSFDLYLTNQGEDEDEINHEFDYLIDGIPDREDCYEYKSEEYEYEND